MNKVFLSTLTLVLISITSSFANIIENEINKVKNSLTDTALNTKHAMTPSKKAKSLIEDSLSKINSECCEENFKYKKEVMEIKVCSFDLAYFPILFESFFKLNFKSLVEVPLEISARNKNNRKKAGRMTELFNLSMLKERLGNMSFEDFYNSISRKFMDVDNEIFKNINLKILYDETMDGLKDFIF